MALTDREVALLQMAHSRPGISRADAARALGISTGGASQLVATLVQAGMLAEGAAVPSGARGRPTRALVASARGPLVLAAQLTHEFWRVDVLEIGGAAVATEQTRHNGPDDPDGDRTLAALAAQVQRLVQAFPHRIRGLGVSAPGTILDGYRLTAVGLGWRDVDLRRIWPDAGLFYADNDATLGGLAESMRGAAVGARLGLHLRIDAGVGGALVESGHVVRGAQGVGGEFGHLPFGDPAIRCPCGAQGCWGTSVDGSALARLLNDDPPADSVTFAERVLARAVAGNELASGAVRTVAANFGRGLAGLVNAVDPDVVTVAGLAPRILAVAPDEAQRSYVAGLMEFRRNAPVEVRAAGLGEAGPLIGAAEQVWSLLWRQLQSDPICETPSEPADTVDVRSARCRSD
jgi:predicted NBD/HSP70 family sugar kinase